MLLPSYFVIDIDKYHLIPAVELPSNAFLSFKLDASNIHFATSFYKNLFSLPQITSFCLFFDLKNLTSLDNNTIELLVSFSFHFNYLRTSDDRPVIIFNSERINSNKHISAMREKFISQGYNDIESMLVGNIGNENIIFDLDKSLDGFQLKYEKSIKQLTSSNVSFIFFLHNPENLSEILDMIQRGESFIRKNLPQTYNLLKENMSHHIKENHLNSKLALLQEQLNSSNNYHLYYNLSDSQYKRQITELLKFYKNEYEILPTWYKRFGHIIKVIMGKRSFRSLFNDNVKKYKD